MKADITITFLIDETIFRRVVSDFFDFGQKYEGHESLEMDEEGRFHLGMSD